MYVLYRGCFYVNETQAVDLTYAYYLLPESGASGRMTVKPAVLKSKRCPVEKFQSLKFPKTKGDHGAESVLVATEKMTVVIVQHASEYMIIIKHIIHTTNRSGMQYN